MSGSKFRRNVEHAVGTLSDKTPEKHSWARCQESIPIDEQKLALKSHYMFHYEKEDSNVREVIVRENLKHKAQVPVSHGLWPLLKMLLKEDQRPGMGQVSSLIFPELENSDIRSDNKIYLPLVRGAVQNKYSCNQNTRQEGPFSKQRST